MKKPPPLQFEQALQRLEQILQTMNEGKAGLDEALTLYEEANTLLTGCTKKLDQAENRIETLIKERNGTLITDEQGSPQSQPLPPQQ